MEPGERIVHHVTSTGSAMSMAVGRRRCPLWLFGTVEFIDFLSVRAAS